MSLFKIMKDKSEDEADFLDILSLMASSDPRILLNSSDLFYDFSFKHPIIVCKSLNEVELLIISICSSNDPHWGVISSILFGLSHVISQVPKILKKRFHTFVKISNQISRTFLSSYRHTSYNFPIQYNYIESIINNYDLSWKLSKKSFFYITENCMIGQICKLSYLQILINKFEDVLAMVMKFEYDELMIIVKPISSPDKSVMQFYLTLWLCIMIDKIDDAVAIRVLRTQSEALLKIKKNKDRFQPAADFLFDIIKTPLKCQKEMASKGKEISEKILALLKTSPEEIEQEEDEHKETTNKVETHSQIFKTQVSVLYNKLVSKKWKDKMELRLVEEASILYWAKNEISFSKGVAIQCSDIEVLTLTPPGETEFDRENVMKIQLRSNKIVYYLAFQSYQHANQWNVLIQGMIKPEDTDNDSVKSNN